MDIMERIKGSAMSPYQVFTIALCLLLVMVDGFDIAVMAMTSAFVKAEWAVSQSMLGYLLSAGLLGMAVGSVLLAPLADRIGRRKLLLLSVTIVTIGMLASGFTVSAGQLLAGRLVTGFGIGGMIAVIGVMLNEFSSKKRYGLIMGFYAAGISMGATAGGSLVGPLIASFGWHSAFIAGGIFSGVLLILCLFWLPESVDFLLEKRRLPELNRVLEKIRIAPLQALPDPVEQQAPKAAVREIFGPQMIARTLLMITGYGFLVVSFYFYANWNPTILAGATGDPGIAVTTTVLSNFVGMLGCLAFGLLATWIRTRLLNTLFMAAAAVGALIYGQSLGSAGFAVAMVLVVGFLTNAGIAGYYSIIPPMFPSRIRATGYGTIIGVGRLAAVAAPVLGGWLLDSGWGPAQTITLFAVPLALSALACTVLDRMARRSLTQDEHDPAGHGTPGAVPAKHASTAP